MIVLDRDKTENDLVDGGLYDFFANFERILFSRSEFLLSVPKKIIKVV